MARVERKAILETVPPQASRDLRTARVFNRSDCLVFFSLTCLSAAVIVFFLLEWFSAGRWNSHPFLFTGFTLIILARIVNSQIRWASLLYMKRPQPLAPRSGLKVAVVTTIVPALESIEMLEETVRALVAMEYPHDTWVLDEANSDAVKAICRKTGVHHFSRKDLPQY